MKFNILILLFISLCYAKISKRVWINTDNPNPQMSVTTILEEPYNTKAYWVSTIVSFGEEADSHYSVILIPYIDAEATTISQAAQPFITDLYMQYDEVTNADGETSYIQKSGMQIMGRNKYTIPSGTTVVQTLEPFEDTAYNIIGRIYESSNKYFGINNQFPPTVDSNDNVKEVLPDNPKAYQLGTNDCQTAAKMIINSLAP